MCLLFRQVYEAPEIKISGAFFIKLNVSDLFGNLK